MQTSPDINTVRGEEDDNPDIDTVGGEEDDKSDTNIVGGEDSTSIVGAEAGVDEFHATLSDH
jgi:hypothetical protein